jgi:tetratricopeptide (TPR) repeat protein
MRPLPEANKAGSVIVLALAACMVLFPGSSVIAQVASPQRPEAITIEGTVRNSAGQPVPAASVSLENGEGSSRAETKTKTDGTFVFSTRRAGAYSLRAQKSGFRNKATDAFTLSAGEKRQFNLVLEASGEAHAAASASAGEMQFEDKPNFTVAGITDWTAAGGHGSDTGLRTSEALAKETVALKTGESEESPPNTPKLSDSENNLRAAAAQSPGNFEANHRLGEFYLRSEKYREAIPFLAAAYQINPGNHANAYDLAMAYKTSGDFVKAREQLQRMIANANDADAHRLLGDLDELLDDPLGAVREYEQAARIDPSEQNYFNWGTELLLHRAIQPAVEVFRKGSVAHPKSARMLAGFGAALYASGSPDEAARRLCEASDLGPANPGPYLFLGKMATASPAQLPCVEQTLARFVHEQPGNAPAHYYYAIALSKALNGSKNPPGVEQVEAQLQKAVSIDPKFGDAYLQLGILYSARGDSKRAITAYKTAIEVNPNLGEAHYRLGRAYKEIGDDANARQEFQMYAQVEKAEAAEVERQRRELRQFLIVLKEQPAASP